MWLFKILNDIVIQFSCQVIFSFFEINFYVLGNYPCWFMQICSLELIHYSGACILHTYHINSHTFYHFLQNMWILDFLCCLAEHPSVHAYSISTVGMTIPVYILNSRAWKFHMLLCPLYQKAFSFYHLEVHKIMPPCLNLYFSGY